jgi:hypothetical protein
MNITGIATCLSRDNMLFSAGDGNYESVFMHLFQTVRSFFDPVLRTLGLTAI